MPIKLLYFLKNGRCRPASQPNELIAVTPIGEIRPQVELAAFRRLQSVRIDYLAVLSLSHFV
jgi:hypothetical protein